jgi:cytochrome c
MGIIMFKRRVQALFVVVVTTLGAVGIAAADEPISFTDGQKLIAKYGCQACHGIDTALSGPSFRAVAKRYSSATEATDELSANILNGSSGAWGNDAMPPQNVPPGDLRKLVHFILGLM